MSADSDRTVAATPLVVLNTDAPSKPVNREQAERERKNRAAQREENIARWKAIEEAGGGDQWIEAELRKKGLAVDADPASLSEAEKGSFKERKKVEAKERRALEKLVWIAFQATHVAHVGTGIYYSDDDEEDATEKQDRLARAKANDLSAMDSPEALAKGLGVTIPVLRWLCFHRQVQATSHYNYWTIPKRDGSKRLITSPKANLKAAQRWLLRNVVEKLPVHHAAHGFLTGRSIVTNATVHSGAEVVVKVDVRDFFPTVSFRRVKGLLRKGGLPENVATLCALLSTEAPREVVEFRGRRWFVARGTRACPQGAPTSPAITNAICWRLDRRLSGLARTFGFRYTRYADDLTFSHRKTEQSPRAAVGALLRGVRAILASEGFQLQDKKTAIRRGGSSQRITGLVVNQAPEGVPQARVPRTVLRKLKAALFNREKGLPAKGEETLAQLKGLAAFVHMADPKRGRAFLDRIEALEKSAP